MLIKNKGKIVHIDNTIVCEKPKIKKICRKNEKINIKFFKYRY